MLRTTGSLFASVAFLACGSALKSTGGDAGTTGAATGGGPLVFAIVGDTRPPNPCATVADCQSGGTDPYPVSVITQIYQDITQVSPTPQFVVATGDYQYNDPGAGTASWQIQQYLTAAQQYKGPIWPTMGNHECTGYTSSECGSDNPDGPTENYNAFLTQMLGALNVQTSTPYYVQTVPAGSGQTAKFVFVAANAWDQTQATWLDQTLAQPTTYTFVVRHEPSSSGSDCPGTPASDAIIQNHPLTLKITGHSHEYRPLDPTYQECIVGNGGAGSGPYGYALCQQRSDGAIQCDGYDQTSNAPVNRAFAVTAAGQATATE